jgi:hypothetical protein
MFQEYFCPSGSGPEVPAIRYYRASAGVVPDCRILLAVIKLRVRGSGPELGRKFRLAGTTSLVPASRYCRRCFGPVLALRRQLVVIKQKGSERWPELEQKFWSGGTTGSADR